MSLTRLGKWFSDLWHSTVQDAPVAPVKRDRVQAGVKLVVESGFGGRRFSAAVIATEMGFRKASVARALRALELKGVVTTAGREGRTQYYVMPH